MTNSMCKCFYTQVEGVKVHINGDPSKMTPEDLKAVLQMAKIAANYTKMKQIQAENAQLNAKN